MTAEPGTMTGPMPSVTEIAAAVGLSEAEVRTMLDEMEADGWLRRHGDLVDLSASGAERIGRPATADVSAKEGAA